MSGPPYYLSSTMNENAADNSEIIETVITKLVTGGAGLGRHEGQAVFVRGTAPGDTVRARVVMRKKGFIEAELVELVDPGPDRQEPPCPHYSVCGGCDLQHLTDEAQQRLKTDIVVDCFQRLGQMDISDRITPPAVAGPSLGYRNKIRLFASPTGQYGLVRKRSNEVVPLDTCLQMPSRFTDEILPWLRTLPPMEQIVLRLDSTGDFLCSLFGRPNRARVLKQIIGGLSSSEPPLAGCRGLLFNNLPLWGRDYLVHRVANKNYRVGVLSFFQANLAEVEAVIAAIKCWLAAKQAPAGWLADLFCGVGLFSLALADRFDGLLAIDSDEYAIHDARNNVQRDSEARDKVTVRQGTITGLLSSANPPAIPDAARESLCCLVDPPRRGLGEYACATLLKLRPRDIIYLSCDPATLARDAQVLCKGGYELQRIQVIDMFPRTAHIESLVFFTA
ncbi:MAG: class I SAM-dependent RNA methyltransferase [bacterium]